MKLVEGVAFGKIAVRTIDKGFCIEDIIDVQNELYLLFCFKGDTKIHKGVILFIRKTTIMRVLQVGVKYQSVRDKSHGERSLITKIANHICVVTRL